MDRRSLALVLGLVVGLSVAPAWASPPVVQWAIPPGKEDAARELLADVPAGAVRFGGPAIGKSSITFGLFDADDQVIASIVLEHRSEADGDEPTSESFVVRAELSAELDGERRAEVEALIGAATASIQAHDDGGFFIKPVNETPDGEPNTSASIVSAPELAPEQARGRWAFEVGIMIAGLSLAAGLSLRARARPSKPEPA